MLEYRALAGLSILDDHEELNLGGPRQRRLVARLLVDRNSVVSADRLADAVFASEPTPGAHTTIRSYVARLRRVIDRPGAASRLVTQARGYRLDVSDEAFDVARFEHSVSAGRARLSQGDATEAVRVLREGLDLWRGEAYEEFADEDWARPEAQRLGELRLVAHELLADAGLACGRAAEVASTVEVLAAENPLRESLQARLMLSLYRSGRQVEALRVYQGYRHLLADELGLEPSPELAELERRILAHDEVLREPSVAGLPLRGYRLGERLGTGRNGTVYAARLPALDRDVAVRIVPEALANDRDFIRTFEADCRRLASLRHEALVPIHDWWREPGAAYVVLRRMTGGTLRDRLAHGPLGASEVAALVGRIGTALVATAQAGIAHGRVVPESVLFDDAGDAYLADFSPGAGGGRTPGDDARDLAALVGEALSGHAWAGGPAPGVPAAVVDALTCALSSPVPPAVGHLVDAVVAALAGDATRPAYERPNPYKGLRAFDEPDAADFFGRDGAVDEIIARLAGDGLASRLVLVVGGSGSGKSSLVRAGLLPRLRRGAVAGSERWFVVDLVLGTSPFKDLAEALRTVSVVTAGDLADDLAAPAPGIDGVLHRLLPGDEELLLVLDKLEDLFTLADEDEQRAFLGGLLDAVTARGSRLRVVATLRADSYDRPLRFERFGDVVGDTTITVAAMSGAELEQAVVGPAERVGRRVEPALVAELVGAVLHEPGALPSLQLTLYELAERSSDGDLALTAYRERGGLDGAIAQRAEELYRSLDATDRDAVRHVFEQLVVVGAEGRPIRRRALRSDLTGPAGPGSDISAIVEDWADARLLTLDRHPESREPTVEVAHEALLREWPRLRRWIEDDREQIVVLAHLREAATTWNELGREWGALYRGAQLDAALQVARTRPADVPRLAQAFLDASRAEVEGERRREAESLERTTRAKRRLSVQLAALGVAFTIALIAGAVAIGQRERADRASRTASAWELAAAAEANVEVDPERSILLALAAVEQSGAGERSALPEATAALHGAVSASRIEVRVPGGGGRLAWNPDGSTLVTEGPPGAGTVVIHDVRTGEAVRAFRAHAVDINDLAFNHDGAMLATAGDDGAVRVWDPDSGAELGGVEGESDDVGAWAPAFSPDGSRLAAAWPRQDLVELVDLATGRTVSEIRVVAAPRAVSFHPGGAQLVVASASEPSVVVVDIPSGNELMKLPTGTRPLRDVAWSPDGTSIATASADGSVRIFDAATGAQRFEHLDRTSDVIALDWSPAADRIVTGHADGTAGVWIVTDAGLEESLVLSAYDTSSGISGVAFSPDGEHLATGDAGNTAARIWDVTISGDAEVANLASAQGTHGAAAFTPDGRYLVATDATGSITVWDARTFTAVHTLGARADRSPAPAAVGDPEASGGEPSPIRFVEVGQGATALVAGAGEAGPVRVWDVRSGEEVFAVSASGSITDVAWNPAGDRLAIASRSQGTGWVTIVDRSGRQLATIPEDSGFTVGSVVFSEDGSLLVTSRLADQRDPTLGRLVVWDWQSGEVVRTVDTPAARAVAAPQGDAVAVISRVPPASEIVEVRRATTGEAAASLVGHAGAVLDLAFDARGSRLATGGGDGTVRVWSPDTGAEQLVLRGHDGPVTSVAFSPDGARLASVGVDGTVRVWALDLGELIDIAERSLTRSFTDEECRQYLHLRSCG